MAISLSTLCSHSWKQVNLEALCQIDPCSDHTGERAHFCPLSKAAKPGGGNRSWTHETWASVPPFTGCVTSGESLNLAALHDSTCKTNSAELISVLKQGHVREGTIQR